MTEARSTRLQQWWVSLQKALAPGLAGIPNSQRVFRRPLIWP